MPLWIVSTAVVGRAARADRRGRARRSARCSCSSPLATLPTYLLNADGGRRFDAIASALPSEVAAAAGLAEPQRWWLVVAGVAATALVVGLGVGCRAGSCSSPSPPCSRSNAGFAWDSRIDAARNTTFAPMDADTVSWVDGAVPSGATGRDAGRRRVGRDARRAAADRVLQRVDRRRRTTSAAGTRRRSRRRKVRVGGGGVLLADTGTVHAGMGRGPEGARPGRRGRRRGDGRGAPALARRRPAPARGARAMRNAARVACGRGRRRLPTRAAAPRSSSSPRSSCSRSRASAGRKAPGRDLESYLAVYVDFWHTNAVFPWEMLNRTPGGAARRRRESSTSAARGSSSSSARSSSPARSCSTRGPRSSSAAGRPCWSASRSCSTRATAIVFHELASEIVFAAGFAVWTAVDRARGAPAVRLVVRGARGRDRAHRADAPREPGLPRRRDPPARARRLRGGCGSAATAAFVGVTVVLLGAWAATNALALRRLRGLAWQRRRTCRSSGRSSSTTSSGPTTARPRASSPPPSSATSCTSEPYRSYGIDLATFFSRGSPREQEDLISLSDRVYGWDSDYSILGRRRGRRCSPTRGRSRGRCSSDFVKELCEAALRRPEGRGDRGGGDERRRRRPPRRRRSS